MLAIVKEINGTRVRVVVRRGHTLETLQGLHPDLKLGCRVEVKRQTNNPYLIRVRTLTIGQTFNTPYEQGCKVATLPDAQGNFEALDSDGVLCTFCVDMVI